MPEFIIRNGLATYRNRMMAALGALVVLSIILIAAFLSAALISYYKPSLLEYRDLSPASLTYGQGQPIKLVSHKRALEDILQVGSDTARCWDSDAGLHTMDEQPWSHAVRAHGWRDDIWYYRVDIDADMVVCCMSGWVLVDPAEHLINRPVIVRTELFGVNGHSVPSAGPLSQVSC